VPVADCSAPPRGWHGITEAWTKASDDLTSLMHIVAHEDIAGIDCCSCITAAVDG
jgi:hypothetical protein